MLRDSSLLVRILGVIGFFIVASLLLRLAAGTFVLLLKLAIPLLIAYFIVKGLSNLRRRR